MSQTRKNFLHRNEGFVCLQCGFENPPQEGSCRNHCTQCLYSRHVDDQTPGDRASTCKGLMEPIGLDVPKKGEQMIRHRCLTCGKEMRNKVAKDDDIEKLIDMSRNISE